MQRVIRNQLLCMIGVMLAMFALGAWAHKFIIDGIMAKPALNIPIFLIFFAAAGLAIMAVYKLKNETLAMQALQVDHAPHKLVQSDPYASPGIVFQEPTLLGHAYRLITEELVKTGRLQIPTGTVHAIITSIDQRINEKKSIIAYFGNLLVFLGLLGAFIGLMRTVGSVGDLIGGMDLSGGGGDGAFAALIEGMKAPLNGMSVGFSSSLFGLATSLVLGAYERFMLTAMKALRNEFEAWLTNVAQLEGSNADDETAGVKDRNQLRAIRRLARLEASLADAQVLGRSTNDAVKDMAASVQALASVIEGQARQRDTSIADLVTQVAVSQRDLMLQVNGMVSALAHERQQTRMALLRVAEAHERLVVTGAQAGGAAAAPAAPAQLSVDEVEFLASFPEPQATGARSLFQRLSRSFNPDAKALGEHQRQTHAIIRDLYASTQRTHHVVQNVVNFLSSRADKERLATAELASQQEQLVAMIETFANRVDAVTEAQKRGQTDLAQQLGEEIRTTRFALEVAMRRLELQVQEQQQVAEEALLASTEAAELAQRTALDVARSGESAPRRRAGGEA